jgi:hypothetical protein
MDSDKIQKVWGELKGNNVLVALLRTHGKLTVPTSLLEELSDYEQTFPTDFISRNGSIMRVSHNNDLTEFGFELAYIDDPMTEGESVMGHVCVRQHPNNGDIQYSDTRPEWAVK